MNHHQYKQFQILDLKSTLAFQPHRQVDKRYNQNMELK
jgi:hypothetical protein